MTFLAVELPNGVKEWRPSVGHSAPIVALAALVASASAGTAVGMAFVSNLAGTVVFGVVAIGIPLSVWAYFRNAKIVITRDWIEKYDLLGRATRSPRAQVAQIDTRYVPQPALCFVTSEGKVLIRVNQRLWTDQQVSEIEAELLS